MRCLGLTVGSAWLIHEIPCVRSLHIEQTKSPPTTEAGCKDGLLSVPKPRVGPLARNERLRTVLSEIVREPCHAKRAGREDGEATDTCDDLAQNFHIEISS